MAEAAVTLPATQVDTPPPAAAPVYVAKKPMKKKKVMKKGKMALKRAREVVGENGEVVPKAPKLSIKQIIANEIADRDIDKVIKEARETVAECEAAIKAADNEAKEYDVVEAKARERMDAVASKVQMAVCKESLALEKLKSARHAQQDAKGGTAQAEQDRAEAGAAISTLELEKETREQTGEFEAAKQLAKETAEKAKISIIESKLKEKEAVVSIKGARSEQAEKEMEIAKENAEANAGAKEGQKATAMKLKAESKNIQLEMKALEKERQQRDKERMLKLKIAAGLKKGKQTLCLANAPAEAKDVD